MQRGGVMSDDVRRMYSREAERVEITPNKQNSKILLEIGCATHVQRRLVVVPVLVSIFIKPPVALVQYIIFHIFTIVA